MNHSHSLWGLTRPKCSASNAKSKRRLARGVRRSGRRLLDPWPTGDCGWSLVKGWHVWLCLLVSDFVWLKCPFWGKVAHIHPLVTGHVRWRCWYESSSAKLHTGCFIFLLQNQGADLSNPFQSWIPCSFRLRYVKNIHRFYEFMRCHGYLLQACAVISTRAGRGGEMWTRWQLISRFETWWRRTYYNYNTIQYISKPQSSGHSKTGKLRTLYLSIYLSIDLSIYRSIHRSIHPSIQTSNLILNGNLNLLNQDLYNLVSSNLTLSYPILPSPIL